MDRRVPGVRHAVRVRHADRLRDFQGGRVRCGVGEAGGNQPHPSFQVVSVKMKWCKVVWTVLKFGVNCYVIVSKDNNFLYIKHLDKTKQPFA